jgi:hypothetical protein
MYFSEEIKWCQDKGYEFEDGDFDGYEFERGLPLKTEMKKDSTGIKRIIYKLGLNALYGYKTYKTKILKMKIR